MCVGEPCLQLPLNQGVITVVTSPGGNKQPTENSTLTLIIAQGRGGQKSSVGKFLIALELFPLPQAPRDTPSTPTHKASPPGVGTQLTEFGVL